MPCCGLSDAHHILYHHLSIVIYPIPNPILLVVRHAPHPTPAAARPPPPQLVREPLFNVTVVAMHSGPGVGLSPSPEQFRARLLGVVTDCVEAVRRTAALTPVTSALPSKGEDGRDKYEPVGTRGAAPANPILLSFVLLLYNFVPAVVLKNQYGELLFLPLLPFSLISTTSFPLNIPYMLFNNNTTPPPTPAGPETMPGGVVPGKLLEFNDGRLDRLLAVEVPRLANVVDANNAGVLEMLHMYMVS